MKKFVFFAAAMMAAITLNAQTITIDGANDDWADVPMLTEPGAPIILKMVVPQEGLTLPDGAAFTLMVAGEHEQILASYPVIYVDADNDNTTGNEVWFVKTMKKDYEMATWSDGTTYAASETGNIREMCIKQSAFSSLPFIGSFGAYLTFNWGALYVPNSPEPSGDNWKWSETAYHHLYIAPYTFANLNGTFAAIDAYSTHQALAPGAALNMEVAGSANDTLLWASWAVELTNPAVYAVSANITSENGSSVDLALVSCATNEVVASFRSEEKWQPTGETALGNWDLSAVPAGKYMLKFSNHIAWSKMLLNSITLAAPEGPSAIDQVSASAKAIKVIRHGQMMIIRDGKTFNALGAEMK